ncbi:hypothetical protein [Allorhizocola rhizosphaerae]|uniref:hypothetical protein n=1 Tax=Allorhizocola rhizosphaerae TaxID=1872709 RepID=UPI0013C2A2E0|nr:hypothetical protein [Allorhizocola rhizosphaerae]
MRVRHLVLAAALAAAMGCASPARVPEVASGDALPAQAADEDERRRQFLNCMREQGAELPAPGTERRVPPSVGPEAERSEAAMQRCRGYLTGGGVPPRPSVDDIEKARAYAKCMRDNGVPYYPDPDPETGRPQLTTELGDRLKRDPKLATADEHCRNRLPHAESDGANA